MIIRPPRRFLCICSGISAPTDALKRHGFSPLAYAEIDPAAAAILAERRGAGRPLFMPDPDEPGLDPAEARSRANAIKQLARIEWGDRVPNYGDFTRLRDDPMIADADFIVGGPPCQDFSLAGLRASLGGDRGNLTMEFIRLVDAVDDLRRAMGRAPAFSLYENVPGILSTEDNAFGTFLGGMVGSDRPILPPKGRGWPRSGVVSGPLRVAAWRELDTQHFGLPQRRRRVFVLSRSNPRGWTAPDALLPIIDSLCGHPPPREGAREGASGDVARSLGGSDDHEVGPGAGRANALARGPRGGAGRADDGGRPRRGRGRQPGEYIPDITGTICADTHPGAYSGQDVYQDRIIAAETSSAVAFSMRGRDGENMAEAEADDVSPTIRTGGGDSSKPFVAQIGPELRAFPISTDALRGDGQAKTATPDASGLVRKRNPGLGVGGEGDPSFTVMASGAPAVATHVLHGLSLSENQQGELRVSELTNSLTTDGGKPGQGYAAAFTVSNQSNGFAWEGDQASTVLARLESPTSGQFSGVRIGVMVRRLTPLECELLQGFEPHFTLTAFGAANRSPEDLEETFQYLLSHGFSENEARALADVPDGHRYRVLGNSMGVDVIDHIGGAVAHELDKEEGLA